MQRFLVTVTQTRTQSAIVRASSREEAERWGLHNLDDFDMYEPGSESDDVDEVRAEARELADKEYEGS